MYVHGLLTVLYHVLYNDKIRKWLIYFMVNHTKLAAIRPSPSAALAALPQPPTTTPIDDVTMSMYGIPVGVCDATP